MHVKIISGEVASTIVLRTGQYGRSLTVSDTGSVQATYYGATVISAPGTLAHARVDNAGLVTGAREYSGYVHGGYVYNGGAGVALLCPGAEVLNSGSILGGQGISGGQYGYAGAGGAGVDLAGGGMQVNSGFITGGSGGSSNDDGGNGGAGVMLARRAW